MEPETRTVPAPYGRTCEECARAKCKCLLRIGGGRCARCSRLDRPCRQLPQKRRRLTNPSRPNPSTLIESVADRTSDLERRFEDFVTSIQTRPAGDGSGSSPSTSVTSTVQAPAHRLPDDLSTTFGTMPYATALAAVRMKAETAEQHLNVFRTSYLPFFPFVVISIHTTAQELYELRPYLWLSIMATCTGPLADLHPLDRLFRQIISQRMVVNSERSTDLLLAILAYLGWYHRRTHAPDASLRYGLALCMHMAQSLVFDLLSPPMYGSHQIIHAQVDRYTPSTFATNQIKAGSMEEIRACLACFLVSSVISLSMPTRIDTTKWSAALGRCLKQLERTPECDGDTLLVHQIRALIIVDKAISFHENESVYSPENTSNYSSQLYVYAMKSDLESFWSSTSEDLKASPLIRMHYHALELAASEVALQPGPFTGESASHANLTQQQLRLSSLRSVKGFFDAYLSLPPEGLVGHPLTVALRAVRCVAMLLHLCKVEAPGWSADLVRAELDPLTLFDRAIAVLTTAIEATSPRDDSLVAQLSLARASRQVWAAKLDPPAAAAAAAAAAQEAEHAPAAVDVDTDAPPPAVEGLEALYNIFNLDFSTHEWRMNALFNDQVSW